MTEVTWRVTACTFWCDTVGDWATVLVYKDGSVRCSHFNTYGPVVVRKKGSREESVCEGPTCKLCLDYKEHVFHRETESKELKQETA